MSLEWKSKKYLGSEKTYLAAKTPKGTYAIEQIPNSEKVEAYFAARKGMDGGELGEYETVSSAKWACEKHRIGEL
jgi:hypothetical protein